MTILNQPSDGLHSVLIAAHRFLLLHGPLPRERLQLFIAPESAVSDDKQFRQTMNSWTSLGLFTETEEGVQVAEKFHSLPLAQAARACALNEDNNQKLWGTDGAADFCRAISWFLSQNAWTVPGGSHADIQKLEQRQLADSDRILQNNTRWGGLKAWGSFLGFCWTARYPNRGTLIADPTIAIRDALPRVFGAESELDHETFRQRLAMVLPVLDSGIYRRHVEERMREEAWYSPRPDQFSTSLTRGLLRLEGSGLLRMESRADAEKCSLMGSDLSDIRAISHFVYTGGSRAT